MAMINNMQTFMTINVTIKTSMLMVMAFNIASNGH